MFMGEGESQRDGNLIALLRKLQTLHYSTLKLYPAPTL